MQKLTHKQKIINILEDAGQRGVHSFELVNRVTHKATSRIADLRRDGEEIISVREKKGNSWGVRYYLADYYNN